MLKADLKPSRIIAPLKDGLLAVLNSYGMLFFSRNKLLSLLVLAVSFFTPFTGFCGLTALLVSITAAFALGFGKEQVRQGLLTYSVILFGLCMGANFEPGAAFLGSGLQGTAIPGASYAGAAYAAEGSVHQNAWHWGAGVDIRISNQAGLYIRHHWFQQQDQNFTEDRIAGTETSVELKIFF